MTLRTRLAVAAGSVLLVLLSAGVLIPRLVRASLIDQVDAQLTASLPIGVGLSSGRVFPAPNVDRAPATRLSEIYIARVEAGKASGGDVNGNPARFISVPILIGRLNPSAAST